MSPTDRQRPPAAVRQSARVLVARGARAAEERLLEEVTAAATERVAAFRSGELGALSTPIRVIVPSRSLREHVSTQLVRRAGRSLLGVAIQTQRTAALELLERAGEALPRGDRLLPVLLRRHARAMPTLAPLIDGLDDGAGVVESAVRDLLDAGLAADTSEAVLDALATADDGAGDGALRASEVARAAVGVSQALAARGLGHRSSLLARARELLEERGGEVLPSAALWVYGFADATGLVAEWLEALVRMLGGAVLVDVPPDPGDRSREEADFPAALLARMQLAAGASDEVGADAPPRIELVRAPGTAAEVRAVAVRVRSLLDAGAAPESIGIVARRLEPWRAALDAQLGRLAIPFSVAGAGAGPDAGSRRISALAQLLEKRSETPCDTWLDADARPGSADADLRLALHVLGAGRLRDLVELDLPQALRGDDFLTLPVRRGFAEPDAPEIESQGASQARRNRRRSIDRGRLERAQTRARGVVERLRAWPAEAPFAAQRGALDALLREDLDWKDGAPGCERAFEALEALDLEVPDRFELERDELAMLVGRALESAREPLLGGAGAGVQVLSAVHARARSFEHLFVLGMNRDVFPRVVVEDALLPDALRRAIREVLPEMPIKARARDEERYLFAELLSSSARVTLTWQHIGDEGRERPESPFVVRLRMLRADLAEANAPMLFEPQDPAVPRPAQEHAALLALQGRSPSARVPVHGLALREVMDLLPDVDERSDPESIARSQIAVIRELEQPRAGAPALGPWLGFAGERPPASHEGPELYVTRLEDIARCGWQMFLRRELGLEPVPDALDALPAPDPLLRGRVVHLALQRIVERQLGDPPKGSGDHPEKLGDVLARAPVSIAWPEEGELEALLREVAREIAWDEGVRLPGFAAALARRVRPMLDAAHAADWSQPLAVLGVEIESETAVSDLAGRERRIGFRADRVDRDARGVLRLTDYKTGKAIDSGKGDATRLGHFTRGVRAGRYLQAPLYWLAARALAPAAEGRFLFLREDTPAQARVFAVDASSEPLAAAFQVTARVVLEAWDRGALLPRLLEPSGDKEPRACEWCEVSAACVRGESAQRRRLREWAARASGDVDSLAPAERALLALYQLGANPVAAAGSAEEEP